MHKYNPLELPEIIANIVRNLSLKYLNKLCWINHTWYKEVKHELRKRFTKEILECYKAIEKEGEEYDKLYKQQYMDIIYYNFKKKDTNFYKDLVLSILERINTDQCIIVNAMISRRVYVKYDIKNLENAWKFSLSIHKRDKCFYIV